ncbi:NADH:flavin oxidoreductase/NADH oxidase [Paenarthrobacter sp. NPDC057981]|uniref:NADH:flavin oxidoreductase/NADH oxidase n=1 Tax=Paenarthrobacter sp. NPDC057981 TaxID=3346297 RepID=UPI0036D9FCAF
MSQKLFEPLKLRGVEFRNRIWVPPMCQYAVAKHDGVATDWHAAHLGAMALGGAGAVIVEATGVVPEGRISPRDLGLWNDEQKEALASIVRFIKSQGAVAGIQLAHAGRKASAWPEWGAEKSDGSLPLESGGWETVAPSAIPFEGMATPRELDQKGIDEALAAFVAAAGRAVEAGFELIEIHGAHGYLLHEFLSPLSNHRTDAYGGSLQNRSRLLRDIVDAVRQEIGEEIALVVRLSATDWADGGITVDETVQLAQWLRGQGVDLIDVSSGGNVLAPIPAGPGYQVPLATAVREQAGIPTAAVGLITDPVQAEQVLVTGQADVVLIGREMMRNPLFPVHAARAVRYSDAPIPRPYHRAFIH